MLALTQYAVFGMGVDLSTFLAVYGAAVDGNLLTWSIGGPDARVSIPLNLLGQPQGISGSHNKYEGDASPTRGDLYVTGNDYDLVLSRFQSLYDAGKAKDEYDLQVLTDNRGKKFQESIDTNPYFWYENQERHIFIIELSLTSFAVCRLLLTKEASSESLRPTQKS
jgi:hypothetical protein